MPVIYSGVNLWSTQLLCCSVHVVILLYTHVSQAVTQVLLRGTLNTFLCCCIFL